MYTVLSTAAPAARPGQAAQERIFTHLIGPEKTDYAPGFFLASSLQSERDERSSMNFLCRFMNSLCRWLISSVVLSSASI